MHDLLSQFLTTRGSLKSRTTSQPKRAGDALSDAADNV